MSSGQTPLEQAWKHWGLETEDFHFAPISAAREEIKLTQILPSNGALEKAGVPLKDRTDVQVLARTSYVLQENAESRTQQIPWDLG